MPDLPFTTSGVAETLGAQDRIRKNAQRLRDEYKAQGAEARRVAAETKRAVSSTLTEAERIQKKIEAIRRAQSKGVGDQAANAEALKRLEAQLKKVQKGSDGAGESLRKSFGAAALSNISRYVGPTAAIATSLGIITNEIRSQLALIDEAADAKISVSASRNAVLRNLPGADEATRRQVLRENREIVSATGVREEAINTARAEALSASGGDVVASREAVAGSARFLFDKPSEIGGFAGSLLDLQKVTGTPDADTNLGLLQQVGGLSRVADPRQQAANIPSALIGLRGFGFTTAESGSLFATLSEFGADKEGAKSKTAGITFAESLRNFKTATLSGRQEELLGEGGIERLAKIENLATGDKLRALQQDRVLADALVAGLGGEAQFKAEIEQLVTDAGSDVSRRFESNRRKIGSNQQLAAVGRGAVQSLETNQLNRLSRFDSGVEAIEQQLAVADGTDNLPANTRKKLRAILQRTGSSNLGARGSELIARLGDDSLGLSIDEATGLLRPVIEDLEDGDTRTESRVVRRGGGGARGGGKRVERRQVAVPATEQELETAKLLRQLIALQGEQNAETKKQTDKITAAAIPSR